MLLRRLELLGFKSFAARATFEFDAGISVLVGPNGSGKSNVADAIRWVLGEQSARALRGKRAEEVIFAGSNSRRPVGMAEVALVLDNSDRRLRLEFAEVRLARRLYRSGESEYLINGARARRKDLVALLLEVGLHSQGYTVIGQGAVEELVIQRPEERRLVLEHAADITRHQSRLAETRGSLEGARANLIRCEDLVAELQPHARRLRGQAERAERYAARRAELAAIAQIYYRGALTEKAAEVETVRSGLAAAATECERLERRIGGSEAERTERRATLASLEAELTALHRATEQAHGQREACLRELATARERIGSLDARVSTRQADSARLTERIVALTVEVASAESEVPDADARQLTELERLDGLVEELGAELRQTRARVEQLRDGQAQLDRRRRALEQEAERRREADGRRAAQVAELAARRAALEERIAEAGTRRQQLTAELELAQKRCAEVKAALAAAEAARRESRKLLAATAEREQRARGELEVASAALQAVEQDAREHGLDGPGDGPSRPRLGTLLQVAAEYEPAIAAALGEWAQAEMADDQAALAAEVQSNSLDGRRLLMARDGGVGEPHGGARRLELDAALGDLWHRHALDVVESHDDPRASNLGELVHTLLVRDVDAAREAARRLSGSVAGPWQLATLDGVVLTHFGGWVLGSHSSADRLVSLRRRRTAARERVETCRRVVQEAGENRAEHEQADRLGEAREMELRAADQEAAAEIRQLVRGLDELETEARRLSSALRDMMLQTERAEGADVPMAGPDALEELGRRLRDDQAREAAERRAAELLQSRWERAWADREGVRLAVESARSERRARQALLEVRAAELARAQRDRALAETEAGQLAAELSSVRDTLSDLEGRSSELSDALAQSAARAEMVASTRTELAQRIEQLEQELSGLRGELDTARSQREAALVAQQHATDELERLREEARGVADEWGLGGEGVVQLRLLDASTPAAVSEVAELPEVDLVGARRRLLALQRELRSQGAVGESVLEEYREVDERLRFLNAQSADLRQAMNELVAIIAELESLMRAGFGDAFRRVNGAFEKTFATLFGGGTARLVLTDPDDALRSGVDIIAQPPGKRLQNLMSLSGGERALTSTALIFALLAINPLPFCVLDEVDAALDESNARRFADLLRDYAERTQFVVVTHNRATMETARSLYGISMGGDGVTTVVSLRPSDPATAARNGQVEHRAEPALQI